MSEINLRELEERLFRWRHRQNYAPPPPKPKREWTKHWMIGDWRTSAKTRREAIKLLRAALGADYPNGAEVYEVVKVRDSWVRRY